jgi:hypothetical protein
MKSLHKLLLLSAALGINPFEGHLPQEPKPLTPADMERDAEVHRERIAKAEAKRARKAAAMLPAHLADTGGKE